MKSNVRPRLAWWMRFCGCLIVKYLILCALSFVTLAQQNRENAVKSLTGDALRESTTSSNFNTSSSQSITPDLFSGVLRLSQMIDVPAGRKGMQPNLTLNYQSTTATASLGVERVTNGFPRTAQDRSEPTVLEIGKPIEREMKGGETHSYRIAMTKDEYLHAVVDQRGIDVALTLVGPTGQKLAEIDSPNGSQGPEPVFVIVPVTGTYRLDIKSLDKTALAGRYEASIEELRAATATDKTRVSAQQALAEGDQLRAQETEDTIRRSIQKYTEAARQFQIIEDRSGGANSLNSIGEAYDDLGEKNKALEYYNQALPLSRSAKNALEEATILKNLGEVYDAIGEKQKALALYDQALPIMHLQGERHGEAIIFNDMAKVYFDLGQMKKSLEFYNRSLILRREVRDLSGEALELNGIGLIYSVLGDREKALEFYNQALPITRSIGDRRGEALVLDDIGSSYFVLGVYDKALESFNKALPLWRSVGSPVGEASALSRIGSTYSAMNDKQKALDYYYQSLSLSESASDRGAQASTLSNIGNVYAEVGEDRKALDFFDQALSLWRAVHSPDGEATTLTNMGASYEALGQTRQALDYYDQALALVRTSGYAYLESVLLNNIGAGHFFLGDNQKAIEFLERALALKQKVGDRLGEVATHDNIGKAYEAVGERQKALEFYNQALSISRSLHDSLAEGDALKNIGALHDATGNRKEALAAYQSSIQATEKARALATVEEIKTDLIGQGTSAYESAAVLLLRLGRSAEAFDLTERARSRTFLDQIGNIHPNIHKGASAELVKSEQTLGSELDSLEKSLRQEEIKPLPLQNAEKRASMVAEITKKEREYEALLTRLKLSSPDYAALRGVSTLTVPEVQNHLRHDRTLLSYFVTPKETVAFVVTKDHFEAFEIPIKASDLGNLISAFRSFDNLNDPQSETLNHLYKLLVRPLRSSLKTSVICIVPHGILHYLPFAALTDGKRYFGDQYTLFILPSASVLPFVKAERKSKATHLLAIAQTQAQGLPTLQHADFEAQSVAALYGTQALVGKAATETFFLDNASQYEILHIAAHGQLNSQNPLFSRIVLATEGRGNGFLEVRNLYALNLDKTDLVVLSACETQLGTRSPGDDIVGLTRALMYSGAGTTIASLWTVDDESTGILMKEFYKHLKAGMGKAMALKEAQRLVRSRYPNPYYWAAFVLSGDPGH